MDGMDWFLDVDLRQVALRSASSDSPLLLQQSCDMGHNLRLLFPATADVRLIKPDHPSKSHFEHWRRK